MPDSGTGSVRGHLPESSLTPPPERVRIDYRRWSVQDFTTYLPEAMVIYAAAMGYPHQVLAARQAVALVHAQQPGFRSMGAHTEDGMLVGFGYGYTTGPGQWWNSEVRRALGPRADSWLGNAFELCELHVVPAWQGRRIGRRVLEILLTDLPGQHVVLSTPEGPTPARRLYETVGFVSIAPNFYFATDQRPFAVMARRSDYDPAGQSSGTPGR